MASQTNMQVSPLRKGLVFDALMVTRIQDGDEAPSTVISCTVKWVKEEKLARLGNVNSPARRKPKYPSVHAAKTMQWSGRCTFRDFQINSMWLSVMGRRLDDKEPWDRLIPRITRCKRRQFCSGSGNPCSRRRADTRQRDLHSRMVYECRQKSCKQTQSAFISGTRRSRGMKLA